MFSVVVNGVVIDKNGKAIIAKRAAKDDHEPGKWTTPGGTMEADGEVYDAVGSTLRREILEEIGITIYDEVILIANNTFIKSNGSKVLALVFLCRHKSGKPRPLDETDDVARVDLESVNKYDFPPNVKEYVIKGLEYYVS